MKTAVISFGRLNPPTVGHEKLVKKIKSVAMKENATPMLFMSHSQDSKKNPLSYDDKIKFTKIAFGPIVKKSKARTLIEVLKELDSKYDQMIVVVGGDRVNEFDKLLSKYNQKDYNYESLKVVSAGERDPDAEGVSGMSASKMRKAASDDDFNKFKSGLPRKLQTKAEEVYDAVRKGMMINEALTLAQRRKRKVIMRKLKTKIQRGKRIAARKKASPEKIDKRSQKQAREILKKKMTGGKTDLTYSQREKIEKRLEKRKAKIKSLAKKLKPSVRKKEAERLKKRTQKESIEITDLLNIVNDIVPSDTILIEKLQRREVTELEKKLSVIARKDKGVESIIQTLKSNKVPTKKEIEKLKSNTRDDVFMTFAHVLGPDETMELFNLDDKDLK